MEGPDPDQECLQLVVGEVIENPGQMLPTAGGDLLEDGSAPVRRVNEHDPPIIGIVLALDEAPLFHPIDDSGCARDRHVEGLGEA